MLAPEGGYGAGLALEAEPLVAIEHLGGDHLQGDAPPEDQVGRAVDDAHRSASEHGVDPELVREDASCGGK